MHGERSKAWAENWVQCLFEFVKLRWNPKIDAQGHSQIVSVVFQEFSGCIQDSVNKMFRWTFPPFGEVANRLVC